MRYILNIFLCFLFFCSISNGIYAASLQKPRNLYIYGYSGDEQTQTTGKITDTPIRVMVTDKDGFPVSKHKLLFEIISYPKSASGFKVQQKEVYTDSLGIAENFFVVGDKEGTYEILVSSTEDCDANNLIYKIHGRKKTWIIYLIMGVLGGLALFLYGMNLLSKGMQAVAGNNLRNLLKQFSKNRYLAFLAGIIFTVIVQSSTVTSVMLVGFVEAGLMSFTQTLGMLLGIGVGTTVTAQLIAFKITDFSLLFIILGFGFTLFSKNIRLINIGKSILGFGLLFFGMYMMSDAMEPLKSTNQFLNILIKLENPLVGIVIGFLFTALIQSSAAFIGIMITIASQGFLTLDACIPLILGTNLGTGITAILASLNSGREAKKVALSYTLFKLIGVLIFIWWIPEFADFIRKISPKAPEGLSEFELLGETVPRQIANAHTVFSIGISIIILPFVNQFGKLINRLFPEKHVEKSEPYKLKYINSALSSSPALALSMAKKETDRMGKKVKEMVSLCLKPFFDKNDENVLNKWQQLENESDFLKENINKYLVNVGSENTDEQILNEAFQIMYVIKELEMIGDIVNTNIRHQANKWMKSDAVFSSQGKTELESFQLKALKQISRSMEVFNDINLEKAQHVKKKFKKYSELAEEYEKSHYGRLIQNYEDSRKSSEIHLELIGLLNSVNRHATNIARIMLNWK
ncbi:MAG: Na/Pi cotransporter family protein [Bacteroidales bacterium]|jgi:phosphate:Na+ symporter|nr:Na/Pi cotransporter family protein [Bacteroidales bacterium]